MTMMLHYITHIIIHVVKSELYAPNCTISSPKMQKLPTVEGGNTPPTPFSHSVALLLRAWSLRSLAISAGDADLVQPPKKFWLITPLNIPIQ